MKNTNCTQMSHEFCQSICMQMHFICCKYNKMAATQIYKINWYICMCTEKGFQAIFYKKKKLLCMKNADKTLEFITLGGLFVRILGMFEQRCECARRLQNVWQFEVIIWSFDVLNLHRLSGIDEKKKQKSKIKKMVGRK